MRPPTAIEQARNIERNSARARVLRAVELACVCADAGTCAACRVWWLLYGGRPSV